MTVNNLSGRLKPAMLGQISKLSQTSELSQTNPSLPPIATRPKNLTLIAANGHKVKQPNTHCRQRPRGQTTKPSSHHAAIMQSSNNQHLIAANGTPIESFGTRQIELQLGLQPGVSSSPTSCSLNSHQIIRHPPNRLSTRATTWRFIIADVMQSQPPQIASIQS